MDTNRKLVAALALLAGLMAAIIYADVLAEMKFTEASRAVIYEKAAMEGVRNEGF